MDFSPLHQSKSPAKPDFETTSRAVQGERRVVTILFCDVEDSTAMAEQLDPEEWDLPPKPKWMRWKTYHRLVERFERYEAMLDAGALSRVSKLVRRS